MLSFFLVVYCCFLFGFFHPPFMHSSAEWLWGFISILPWSELTETLMKLQLQYKCSCFLVDHFLEGRYVKMCSNRNWNNNISLHICCNYCSLCEQPKIYVALLLSLACTVILFQQLLVILHSYSDGVCDCCPTGTFAIKENGCQSTRVPIFFVKDSLALERAQIFSPAALFIFIDAIDPRTNVCCYPWLI